MKICAHYPVIKGWWTIKTLQVHLRIQNSNIKSLDFDFNINSYTTRTLILINTFFQSFSLIKITMKMKGGKGSQVVSMANKRSAPKTLFFVTQINDKHLNFKF